MRDAFAQELTALAAMDDRVTLLSGDIGNRMFDTFKSRYPERFMNCGAAEANLMGMAAGLASCGMRPVCYTIVPFITTRCLEQIRVDVCYQDLPVVIVGVGGGLCYAELGATHHSCEDIAFLRAIPGMSVVCPGDPVEVRLALRAALSLNGPVYLRLGKKGEPVVHADEPHFAIGKAIVLSKPGEVCLLSVGDMLPTVLHAGELLRAKGVAAGVVSFHTVKPLDEALLKELFATCSVVAAVEEHSMIGGFGAAVAEWVADQEPQKARLVRCATPDRFFHKSGGQEYIRECLGLTPEAIAENVLRALDGA